MSFTTITRPALGQIASLGDLYDARTDTFTTISLFSKPPPATAITVTDNHSSDLRYVHSDTFKEKFTQFGITPQLSASVAAGLIGVSGSGRYLTSQRDTKLAVQSSLIYNITTVNERINFQLEELEHSLALGALRDNIATHVVSEINWGSRNVVTLRQSVSHWEDQSLVAGQIDAQLKSLNFGFSGELTQDNAHAGFNTTFEVAVEADVVATDGSVPKDLATAEAFIGNVKKYVDATNGGKGKPLLYCLLPLAELARLLNVKVAKQITLRELGSDCAEQFVQAFDQITDVRQKLKGSQSLLQINSPYIPSNDLVSCTKAVLQVNILEARLRTEYGKAVADVRAGKTDETVLWRILDNFRNSETSLEQITKLDFRSTKEKIRLITDLVKKGAQYIGFNGESLDLELARALDSDVLVFSFTQASRSECIDWPQNVGLLYQLLGEKVASPRILLHDYDAAGEELLKSKITLYRNTQVVIENILDKQRTDAKKPLARYNSAHLERTGVSKPVKRIAVKLPCLAKQCTASAKYDWMCSECGCHIEYNRMDSYIYCDCGRCDYRSWDFRCPNLDHGRDFSEYSHDLLRDLLENLAPFDECNILILGRTGVGKSTWINSLANYLTYDSLDDAAAANSLTWKIPFSFTTYTFDESGNYSAIKVQAGFDNFDDGPGSNSPQLEEHDGSTGVSGTQNTREHTLFVNECRVRLIDTPGIGDTRGASQDKENMADILSVLQLYPKLHGILILLKPNDQRLDIMFRFCMQELLSHLHRDAARNIAFGFTNTRGTNYQPGDSLVPLSQLLRTLPDIDIAIRRHNVYCFDSESFRYLAAYKQHNLSLGPREENASSWERSVSESRRLIKYFQGLEPHRVTSSVNLYEMRTCIVAMARPMAMIAQAIKSSIAVNEDDMKALDQNAESRKELERSLKVKVSTIAIIPVDRPRTTCHDDDCVSHVGTNSWGRDGEQVLKTVYQTMCHSPCYLKGVQVENLGNPQLQDCAAMKGGICKVCNHSWKVHLHIDYEQVVGTSEVDNPTIVTMLSENADFADMKQAAIAAKEVHIEELQSELQEFTSAAAQFSIFLKRNAIMPYNDATLDYLDRTIEEEKGKVAVGGSRDRLEQLCQYRQQYEKEVEILDEYMIKGESSRLLDREGVELLVQKLHALPHYGQSLKDMGKVVNSLRSLERRERPQKANKTRRFARTGDLTGTTQKAGSIWRSLLTRLQ
ncbi:hypothetical protein BJY01DRAFT_244664 [Aspergillus pseudoustus]|uniref:G domain-containing protein n=1 Tax=Aspergillus pseudoustus TaxID=1810923 RepID=A0ABR4KIE1_9EURO